MNKLARTYRIDYARLRTAAKPHYGYICSLSGCACVCVPYEYLRRRIYENNVPQLQDAIAIAFRCPTKGKSCLCNAKFCRVPRDKK